MRNLVVYVRLSVLLRLLNDNGGLNILIGLENRNVYVIFVKNVFESGYLKDPEG
jgi:hypothetical protein